MADITLAVTFEDGEYHVWFTGCQTIEELQKALDSDDRAVALLEFPNKDCEHVSFEAIGALAYLNLGEDGVGDGLDRIFTQVFRMGFREGQKTKILKGGEYNG